MVSLRYIHAADLHLDAPLYGLSKNDSALAERTRRATGRALDNLVALCVAQRPDFLLVAGDSIHQRGIHARLRLRDAYAQLAKVGIPVFMVHGNHDPAADHLNAINWPPNTVIFGPTPETHTVFRDGEPLALVQGVSHGTDREDRNLAALMHRDATQNCFQVGLLHCNVDGAVAEDRYAPCSMADLLATGLDAWALGHAHTRRILNESPFIAYAGNTQGLHVKETGQRGCLLVEVQREDDGWRCTPTFYPLAPVQWATDSIDLEGCLTFDAVAEAINTAMDKAAAQAGDAELVILSADLTGRTPLHNALSAMDVMAELAPTPLQVGEKEVWLRRLEVLTAPPVDPGDNLGRDDLLGEVSRLGRSLEGNDAQLATAIKKAIGPAATACRQLAPPLTPERSQELLHKALRICQDMLEGR